MFYRIHVFQGPGFSGSRFSKVQVFQGSGPGSGFKKFATRSVFGELQLTQISLNFKTSCVTCVWLFCYLILKGIMMFKVKESMQKYKL